MLSPSVAYLVDLMHSRSAEATAANKSVNLKFYGGTSLTLVLVHSAPS